MTPDAPTSTDLRPSRRTVTRAAAWSVPVVAAATAAPAYAASCAPARMTVSNVDYRSITRPSATKWGVTFVPGGKPASANNVLTVTADYDKEMTARTSGDANDNFMIQQQVGALRTYGLIMAQRPVADTPKPPLEAVGRYTFTFSKPVSNLTFTLTDIDSAAGDFLDSVVLSSSFTAVVPADSTVQGRGTAAEPFRPRSSNTPIDNTNSPAGNVTITYPGALSSFQITYKNAADAFYANVDQDQVITISNFAFDYQPC